MTHKIQQIQPLLKYGSIFLFVALMAEIGWLHLLEKTPIEPRRIEIFILIQLYFLFCFFWPFLICKFQEKMRLHLKGRQYPVHISIVLSDKVLVNFTIFLFVISPIVCTFLFKFWKTDF